MDEEVLNLAKKLRSISDEVGSIIAATAVMEELRKRDSAIDKLSKRVAYLESTISED